MNCGEAVPPAAVKWFSSQKGNEINTRNVQMGVVFNTHWHANRTATVFIFIKLNIYFIYNDYSTRSAVLMAKSRESNDLNTTSRQKQGFFRKK